ncbi:MAG: cation:proton antiporter [Nannocystaceae bacterium]
MHTGLLSDLSIVTIVAAVTGMLTRRLGQPSVLGYLFAGLIVGPYIPIPLFADPHRMTELAEVGVVLVMFAVGLEFRVRRLLEIIPVSGLTAVAQIAALWWAGFTVGSLLDWTTSASICLGATLAISSTMVVSAVLRARPVDPDVRSHVFGILVVQDVVAIVLMALVTALAAGETVGLAALGLLLGQLAGAVAAMLILGLLVLPRLIRYALKQADTEVLVVLIAGAAFGLAMAANEFGYSVALGAFISGMAVAESGRAHEVEHTLEPLRGLFSAIFFVSIGMSVDPFVAWKTLPFALLLCAVVVGMQFIAVTLTTVLTGSSLRRGIYSGLALGQIGELSFILATIAIGGGIVPDETLPALVTVATITAFTTPLLLGRAQRIVEAIDHMLPARAHQVLASYQSFIREARSPEARPLRRPAIAVILDWSALLVLFISRHTVLQHVEPELEAVVSGVAVLLAAPFVVGLLRSGASLVAGVRELARRRSGTDQRARVIKAVALLAVVLGVGLPTLALMRPLVQGPWVEAALLLALLLALVILGLRVGELKGEYTSGVARLAIDLADRVGAGESLTAPAPGPADQGPLAGFDYDSVAVAAAGPADGRSLAELDLRCKTGATVLAISRAGATTTLPTGQEILRAGDVLAVSGSAEAIARARALIDAAADPAPATATAP